MPLTELDLHRVTGRAGWVAGRAALSEDELNSLLALVKPPMSSERRAEFSYWLKEVFAQYVESLTRRAQMLNTLSRHSAPARWMYDKPHVRRPKLSTLAKGEVQEVDRDLQRAEGVLD